MSYSYPLFFERTRKLVRLYEILNGSRAHSFVLPSILKNVQVQQTDYQALDNLIFNKQGLTSFEILDYHDYLKADKQEGDGFRNLHIFEKVLFSLKEECLSLDEIKKLPNIVSLPILEIIRYARLF